MERESYRRGMEDALELCFHEVNKAEKLEVARNSIKELLGLVKEDKLDWIRKMLWMIE